MNYTIKQGNNIDILKQYTDNHFDSIVTDPPYGIEFLGKDWDSNTGAVETWKECYRVLKPGGHLLAFSAARTYHHLATNIENCGFEIRDQLMWIYASGFPKAQTVKNHTGWKTSLKPAHEPIVMARKPFKGSTYANMDSYGVGALNIDASRVEWDGKVPSGVNGKDPRNRLLELPGKTVETRPGETDVWKGNEQGRYPSNVLGEITDYQKYFYCPKVSRAERHCGFEQNNIPTDPSGMWDIDGTGVQYNANKGSLDHIITKDATNGGNHYSTSTHPTDPNLPNYTQDGTLGRMKDKMHQPQVGNNHPTVKPVALMKYLIQLVTPKGGSVLDPFCGSGSTGMACVEADMTFTGCELDPNYVAIANKRIEAWYNKTQPDNNFNKLFD